MQYYHYEQRAKMKAEIKNLNIDAILQKNFPENDKWGACVYFDKDCNLDFIEINKLSDVTQNGATWTHYCTIGVYKKSKDENNGQYWELYSQFNGKDENELWVLGYYKDFGHAARRVRLGIEKLKPIKIY